MVKQFIIAALEEVLGEYILNIPKESLSIAALKGEIKLENVQLDGDLVGSHFLGILGITSFGVLSCSAKSIRMSLPWNQIEKEPTRALVEGVHLVCVPLIPTTANQVYGAGIVSDPRCSLGTRAKRLALARYERFFWNGQIPGEGPPLKRVRRAVKDVERDIKYNKRKTKQSRVPRLHRSNSSSSLGNNSQRSTKSTISNRDDFSEMEDALDELVNSIATEKHDNSNPTTDDDNSTSTAQTDSEELPTLPRDWKVKLREKVMRNLEATMKNVHIRCEVPQRSYLDSNDTECKGSRTKSSMEDHAFTFGFTIENIVIRTANENWEVGSHDTKNPHDGTEMSSIKDHLGPNEYMVVNNKIGYFNNISFYWDDDPPILLSETDSLKGNHQQISTDKINTRIAEAMDSLVYNQELVPSLRESLSICSTLSPVCVAQHTYICQALSTEVRVRTSDRTQPGPISCSADVMPFDFTFDFLPHQLLQYQHLKSQMLEQQRFDTMQRQRPSKRPLDSPRVWWLYAISCVMSRPNSRPWKDILPIVKNRQRYIELVLKKNTRNSRLLGYHTGLSTSESEELLKIEDLLPIEVLLAFHTIAMRKAYASQKRQDAIAESQQCLPPKESDVKTKTNRPAIFRLPRIGGGSNNKKSKTDKEIQDTPPPDNPTDRIGSPRADSKIRTFTLLDCMTLRLGRKVWYVDWKLHDAVINLQLRKNAESEPIVRFSFRADGRARSFGLGKRDFLFDLSQFDILHRNDKILFINPVDVESDTDEEMGGLPAKCNKTGVSRSGPNMKLPSTYLDLPPSGSVCRLAAGKNIDAVMISVSAHPATLVCGTSLLKGISDFVSAQSSETDYDLALHVRNAATPLARKAQLALLSPAAMSLHLNIAAPKAWVALVDSHDKRGTLFIDAGTIRVSSVKSTGETDADWDFHAIEMGVTLVRGVDPMTIGNEGNSHFRTYGVPFPPIGRVESSIIKSLSIDAKSRLQNSSSRNDEKQTTKTIPPVRDSVRKTEISISPICLNLVDAEILARSVGKWYAIILGRVRRRVQSKDEIPETLNRQGASHQDSSELHVLQRYGAPRVISIKIQKLEMALEGRSKNATSSTNDDTSFISLDTLLENAPPSRAYLVEVFEIGLSKTTTQIADTTTLTIGDATIVRLKDAASYLPLKVRRDQITSENCVLSRESTDHVHRRSIFRATHFRNRAFYIDEVEVDIDSVGVRLTPTTLKDCAKALKRIAELAQLVTKEMERKVHEEGRKARKERRGRDLESSKFGSFVVGGDRPVSPSLSDIMTDISTTIDNSSSGPGPSDSSILFRVTMNQCTIMAGKPTSTLEGAPSSPRKNGAPSFVVIQIVSNALVMFQSIENPDSSGSKTLHVSVDNLSALVNREFRRVSLSEVPPMIEPTGAEFRVVYSTENFGCVASQDISLDCESIRSCLTPNDISIVTNISWTMFDRLRAFSTNPNPNDVTTNVGKRMRFNPLIQYKKKGTGIATRVRAEVHILSFVLLRSYKSHYGAPEFLDFNIQEVKASLEGCLSALSGDVTGAISLNFFNSDARDWEYVLEPFPLTLGFEQMPNEIFIVASPSCPIQVNVTGIFLRDISEMQFDFWQDRLADARSDREYLHPSALVSVGLRRASETRSVSIENATGLDVYLQVGGMHVNHDATLVKDGSATVLSFVAGEPECEDVSLSLTLAGSAVGLIGPRAPVKKLPINRRKKGNHMFYLRPLSTHGSLRNGNSPSRKSPEGISQSVLTSFSDADWGYYNADPVVEWCMQNQRIKSYISDVYSLSKGKDLLSNTIWSPEGESFAGSFPFKDYAFGDKDGKNGQQQIPRVQLQSATSNWQSPYLADDPAEWTDMTCKTRLCRDRFVLPDNRWMWINDWTVQVSGKLGKEVDADGWSYSSDFETFLNETQFYRRGAACRRRRWTRTRMLKPPHMNDPARQIKLLWETMKTPDGSFSVAVRSHVRVINKTFHSLAVFAYSPSWNDDKHVGTIVDAGILSLSVLYASASHLRIARRLGAQENLQLENCLASNRFTIIPASHTASRFERTSIDLNDVSETTLHFLVEIKSENGAVDIIIEPVCRIINLLPCQLECNFGEASNCSVDSKKRRRAVESENIIVKKESLTISSGRTGACTAISPWSKAHVSLRVPGYKWSNWYRIVNSSRDTWRPSEKEEDTIFASRENDNDYAHEIKTLLRFDRVNKQSDPLVIIMSVECGHSPTIRIFAQYWILDKTGFGCRFAEGFTDVMGVEPDPETSRRSYHLPKEKDTSELRQDLLLPGHQWSIGKSGTTLYFSKREKLTMSIEMGISKTKRAANPSSTWISPLDVSNVIPKTVFSVDEFGGQRRFELAIHVKVCPGIFARTKMITLLPRFLIVNLLHRELLVCQDGCFDMKTSLPAQSTKAFHWKNRTLDSKIRIGAPTSALGVGGNSDACWTTGRVQVDCVGITSMRLPTPESAFASIPMVIQTEVRLATLQQDAAVVIVIWSGDEKSNPLYMLRNRTRFPILCRQVLRDHGPQGDISVESSARFDCGVEIGPFLNTYLGYNQSTEFTWKLKSNESACFGLENPELPHVIEWTCGQGAFPTFKKGNPRAYQDIDAMGCFSLAHAPGGKKVQCMIRAEHSTKVIEFVESDFISENKLKVATSLSLEGGLIDHVEEDENVSISFRIEVPYLSVSVIDNANPETHGREILLCHVEKILLALSQGKERCHEFELKMYSFQVDNHVQNSVHPILIFCPQLHEREPLLHMSAVIRQQLHSDTRVFRYAAFRLLNVELFLDRRTAETIARFIQPVLLFRDREKENNFDWLTKLTQAMQLNFNSPDPSASRNAEKMMIAANSGRIYVEQLHLHPVRLSLTFTQEWMDWNQSADSVMIFQFMRGMASIANAPIVFTSFFVGHVFEAPEALIRIIGTHYSSQLTKQIFGVLGSLAILGAPADFISNVGTGVIDFFYEPIQGAVHGPRQFFEGLEAGTQSLARGVFVGVVRSTANVSDIVNSNLAGLTADDDFINERQAYRRMLTDARSRGIATRTLAESAKLAFASFARSIKSGAIGIVQQPSRYASKHGPVGLLKGVGKAALGAVVKPIVGFGDGMVLVMNHLSDSASKEQVFLKIPKRLRRALPCGVADKPNCVRLEPFDERAAKAQTIVTGGDSVDDVYLGHVNIQTHLIIASEQSLWAIDRVSRDPWCISWREISHFHATDGSVHIVVFSQTGLKTFVFEVEGQQQLQDLQSLLSIQLGKMANQSEVNRSILNRDAANTIDQVPVLRLPVLDHVFGSFNNTNRRLSTSVKDEIDLVRQCYARVRKMKCDQNGFLKNLDQEAWNLINSCGQFFSGLNARRCVVASIVNITGHPIQIKSSKLMEGGSACYAIPTKEYDAEQGILYAGGVIIFFGWGTIPNLIQAGSVFISIEANAFTCDLVDQKYRDTGAKAMPGYQVGFLEKSYDDSGWWAKYWLVVRNE